MAQRAGGGSNSGLRGQLSYWREQFITRMARVDERTLDNNSHRQARTPAISGIVSMRPSAHTGLILAARITLRHFSVSSAINFPNWVGDRANGVPPKSAIRAFNLVSARPALISLLILSMTSGGVPVGVPIPYHANSPTAGTSGNRPHIDAANPTYRGNISARGATSAISAINFLMSKLPKELKSFATKTKAPGPPITLSR
jgi:hypothetical protein